MCRAQMGKRAPGGVRVLSLLRCGAVQGSAASGLAGVRALLAKGPITIAKRQQQPHKCPPTTACGQRGPM